MKRPNRTINIFSISALDLFASAMGAFLIIALVLFPYFMKEGDMSSQLAAANEEAAKAKGMIPRPLEIVFVCDTTGSMGKHLEQVKNEIVVIVKTLKLICGDLRVGFIAYRDIVDRSSSYVTLPYALNTIETEVSVNKIKDWVDLLDAKGGGSGLPESLSNALEESLALGWKLDEDWNRMIVVMTDATANKVSKSYSLASQFKGGKWEGKVSSIFVDTGGEDSYKLEVENFLKELASKGNGTYKKGSGQMITDLVESVVPAR